MFDLGWSEIGLVVVIAVIILGPKELPRAMRTAGHWMRKLRMLAGDFQQHLDAMVDEAELGELRDQAKRLKTINVSQEFGRSIDPDGAVKAALDDVKATTEDSQAQIQQAAKQGDVPPAEKAVEALPQASADPAAGSRV
jgi:sec-independent protein translocase protein TatB